VKALVTLKRSIQIMKTIFTLKDRDETFKERHIKHPVKQKNHDSKQFDHSFNVVLLILKEVVHIDQ
jgi:hypothetical protein